ncbi:ATP-dependent RNA helicase HrpA [Corynebacterium sp. 11A]|uniref:ATP-dependent RNA helicase HrpA n=1 Tax=Corynebacterium sp. 11A TaxID=2080510 RepID=UPI00124D3AB5|nr:ATP-dependent RNA helicase HrpA [Corynebacterium sp. 11A]
MPRSEHGSPAASSSAPSKKDLLARLENVSLAAERSFRRRLRKARSPRALNAIAADIDSAELSVLAIDERVPTLSYPESLPVSARREDIKEAIRDHQVVIIAGETGSGKTTQIPKMCLELGRGRRGLIGHTQPRRLAARTVAERIASELDQQIGDSVGYAIRFDDRVSETTAVKLMTDGILLAEMQRDRYLNAYDTIIIDEAHERSLNIDFLLGYLKRLLPKRPDLKVIITSATIDPERFATHFGSESTPAPIIEVSGRTYPVEIRYRPLEITQGEKTIDIDPLDGLLEAIEELMQEGPGDILCFFPSERDIRDAMEAIEAKRYRGVEVTPLFGRLSNAEQHRVFSPHAGRRIVLATNIAETSLTVPGIHYVIDTGTARISRYSTRTKVQRLPIEEISQASARQRSGRCGRVAEGIAIRLYSEQNFLSRPEFTDPEILRTNLASVILQMASLRLGAITEFPFVQAPEYKAIRDGLMLLHELGALEQGEKEGNPILTPIGRQLARIPLDPRLARMLIAGNERGVARDVMVLTAALTIQDVRERPLEKQAQADQAHARFKKTSSDFLSLLNLWDYIQASRAELSGNKFRKKMQSEYLHYMRIREWWDLVRQLEQVARQLGWKRHDAPTEPEATPEEVIARNQDTEHRDVTGIHMSMLAGLLSHIGVREEKTKEYLGTRTTRFRIFPGSHVAKKQPAYVMAAELVETSRLWGRTVSEIDPRWVEKLAKDLLRHQYSEPHWSSKRAAAMVYQRSTLWGVPVVVDRLTAYHTVDRAAARDMFIRHALIEGDWNTHHEFFHSNAAKLDEASHLEAKARRRDIVVDEDTLFRFYDERLPEDVTTGPSFDGWWKRKRRAAADYLDFDPGKLVNPDAEDVAEEAFPDKWQQGSLVFDLSYEFEPGSEFDGVTVRIPIPVLAGVEAAEFAWLVPGLRSELLTELLRSLPKHLRRSVVPAPTFAERVLPSLVPYTSTVTQQLAEGLNKLGATGINPGDFSFEKLDPHLRMTFAAIDKRGKVVDHDKDLEALKKRQAGRIQSSVRKRAHSRAAAPVHSWDKNSIGEIAETHDTQVDGQSFTTYPALVIKDGGLVVEAMPTKEAADAAMLTAQLTLLMRSISVNQRQMLNGLPLKQRVAVENYPHGKAAGLIEDARVTAIRDLMLAHGGPVRTPEEFETLSTAVSPEVPGRVRSIIVALAPGLVDYSYLASELEQWTGDAIADMKQQLEFLLPQGAVAKHGIEHLRHLPRYLAAMRIRLDDMERDPDRDFDLLDEIEAVEDALEKRLSSLPDNRARTREVKDIRWMIQEFRVSLFAQRLGTSGPVSAKRIEKAIARLR